MKTNEAIAEFRDCFIETEYGLDHAHAEVIRKAGEKLIKALAEKDKEIERILNEVIWRSNSIKEDLQTPHSYGLDEWSTPVKNLKSLEAYIQQIKSNLTTP